MFGATVTFANAYDAAADADFFVVWNPPEKNPRGYVPILDGTPKVLMNATLEIVREDHGTSSLSASSFVVRNPSNPDVAIGVNFYTNGSPDSVPSAEETELFQTGVSVDARIHIFPNPSPEECKLAVQSTPSSQWQTITNTDRNYKHVDLFPAKAAADDRWCTIC